jgi:hypothetical protein
MAKHIAQPVAELVADGGDLLIGSAAIRTGIAAIFDEGDLGVGGAENMILVLIHRAVEPVARSRVEHAKNPSQFVGNGSEKPAVAPGREQRRRKRRSV